MPPDAASHGQAWPDLEVAVPPPGPHMPGIRMAGFHQLVPVSWDISMVPHPSVTLLIDLSEGESAVYETGGHDRRGSIVAGLLPGAVRASGRARVECLQIRLTPVRAAAVLGPSAELTGMVASLEQVWVRDADRAVDRLRAAASWDERFAIAARLLEQRPAGRRIDAEVAQAWRRTTAARGRLRVEDLAGEVGWSRKRLWSRFRSQLGITPKSAARLARFDHAARLLAAGHAPASVAGRTGYADQSHLHREVAAFTGLTPRAVAAAPWLAIDDVAWPEPRSPVTSQL
ncbi:AraC family transcriptional regulator [Actinoplanes sp. M2I2]|uniref:helix-turn-helix domain-containing protein n=1 Tax=Actinoplanes sp. M2I2 TaxID=1734444 RepID=UPI0020217344|nr:helix-turn-helix transcriptional regulator [Actinoplanes sp. M2I2]